MRADIFADIPIAEMTLDQLAFRRNGHRHDIADHHRRGDRDARPNVLATQSELAEVDAEIKQRLLGKAET